ncbi:MAG: FAD-dependent oxidoreductase [Pirellulales bacterium]|nr:FAD-dependent oxidoreductase [Pirellulales bacterium]
MKRATRWMWLFVYLAACPTMAADAGSRPAPSVNESARTIPIVHDVDVVVVGGSTGAVAAAVAAARDGAMVFLAAPRPYLGEDVCATMRLWGPAGEDPGTMAKALLGEDAPARPMDVKRRLDDALLAAGVQFLYGCQPTDVLRDPEGNLAGIVMANRCGRQAVRAKVVIDATARATVARLAGARFRPYPAGPQVFQWIVLGGQPRPGDDGAVAPLDEPPAEHTAFRYTLAMLSIPMPDGSFAAFAEADQVARDKTFNPGQTDSSETVFQVPPDAMRGQATSHGAWPGARQIDLGAFRPAGVDRVWVLGGCADVDRASAEILLRPATLIAMGQRVGKAAAEESKRLAKPEAVVVAGDPPSAQAAPGDVGELLGGVRATQRELPLAQSPARALPVWGEYDVVVAGGGTSGAPAAIAAARRGAKTLVVEYLPALGGTGTLGGINRYWHGNRVGFFDEVERGVAAIDAVIPALGKAEFWRRECRKAGVDVWLGVLACGAVVDRGTVRGVVVATPQGRAAILAKVVIDATANADVAAAAGADCRAPDGGELAMQMAGVAFRRPAEMRCNTAFTFADDTDLVDLWQSVVIARRRWASAYDLVQLVQTRSRRSIVGDLTLTPVDQHAGRTFPDSVVLCYSNYDKYNFAVHPLYLIRSPDKGLLIWSYVPYRCLLPKGLDGILVIGLGKSADCDTMPIVRMQADMQNEGYAAGLAAAMAAGEDKPPRSIDVRALQRQLVDLGNLPGIVLEENDSFPPSRQRLAEAIDRAGVLGYDDLAIILAADRAEALPLLGAAHERSTGEAKLAYAKILGVLGDRAAAPTLAEAVRAAAWDEGQNVEPLGNVGGAYSEMDLLVIALGLTRDPAAAAPLIEKLGQLDPHSPYSHCRAIAAALETLGDPGAAEPLAELLRRPGMTGHAITTIDQAEAAFGAGEPRSNAHLNERLRELVLARALVRCGDWQDLGARILDDYRADLCGHFARYAEAALREPKRGGE